MMTMIDLFEDVGDFHEKFGLPATRDSESEPHLLTEDAATFRTKFMIEELQEFRDAQAAGNLVEAADALVDLVYVALGTAQLMQIPFNELWDEVHRANMKKVRANGSDDPRSKRAHTLDVVKPEGWKHPDLAKILGV